MDENIGVLWFGGILADDMGLGKRCKASHSSISTD